MAIKNAIEKKVLGGKRKKAITQTSEAVKRKRKSKTSGKTVHWSKKKFLEKGSGTTGGKGSPVASGKLLDGVKTPVTTSRKSSRKKFNKKAHAVKKGSGTTGGSGSPARTTNMAADGKTSGTTGGKGSPAKKK